MNTQNKIKNRRFLIIMISSILIYLFVFRSFLFMPSGTENPVSNNSTERDSTAINRIFYSGDSIYDFIEKPEYVSDTQKIFLIGDSQRIGFWESLYWDFWNENNSEKTRIIFREMAFRKPFCIIHLGDLTAKGSLRSSWKNFEIDNNPVISEKIPYFPVFGNHDYFGRNKDCYDNFYTHFPYLSGKKWYSLVTGKICLVLLNSNFSELNDSEIMEQKKWYSKMLERTDADSSIKYVIVCSHHPPFTNSKIVSPSEEVLQDFVPGFMKNKKTCLFMSGHCHSYEKFIKDGKYFIVSGGGGGPRQKVNIDKKSRKFDDKYDGPGLRFLHYCELSFHNNKLELKVIKLGDDGLFSIADEISIY
jgi:hypothetical protein